MELYVELPQVYGKIENNQMIISNQLAIPDSDDVNDWVIYNNEEEAIQALRPLLQEELSYQENRINELEQKVIELTDTQFTITGGSEYEE